jgi:hypothetical protein
VQPSPTTGKLPFLQSNNIANQFGDASVSFSFKPSLEKKVFFFQFYESLSVKKGTDKISVGGIIRSVAELLWFLLSL